MRGFPGLSAMILTQIQRTSSSCCYCFHPSPAAGWEREEQKLRSDPGKLMVEPWTSSHQRQTSLDWQPKMRCGGSCVWSSLRQRLDLRTEILWSASIKNYFTQPYGKKGEEGSVTSRTLCHLIALSLFPIWRAVWVCYKDLAFLVRNASGSSSYLGLLIATQSAAHCSHLPRMLLLCEFTTMVCVINFWTKPRPWHKEEITL